MFRPVRKKKNEISMEDTKALLKAAKRGVLAVNGDDGYPYAFPINYLYVEEVGKIYFHGAKAGHKVEAIKACDKVCFTVMGDPIAKISEEAWAPFVKSAVVYGRCRLIEDQEEAIELVKPFARKYFPSEELVLEEVATTGRAVQVFEITIEHMSGKEVQEK